MLQPWIEVGGNLLENSILGSVEVVQELNHHSWCTIVCRQTADQRLAVEEMLGKTLAGC
jgi:hypothetical protein